MQLLRSLVAASFVVTSLVACGGGAQPAPQANSPQKLAAASPLADAPVGPVHVTRSQVKRFAARPGEFFQSVELDDRAVFADGKFHGFRVIALRDGLERSGLQPGDVVVSVNKMPIERPEHTIALFRSLEKAKELRVDYERNGEPKTVTVPIIDDGGPAPGPLGIASAPATPPAGPAATVSAPSAPVAPATAPATR